MKWSEKKKTANYRETFAKARGKIIRDDATRLRQAEKTKRKNSPEKLVWKPLAGDNINIYVGT